MQHLRNAPHVGKAVVAAGGSEAAELLGALLLAFVLRADLRQPATDRYANGLPAADSASSLDGRRHSDRRIRRGATRVRADQGRADSSSSRPSWRLRTMPSTNIMASITWASLRAMVANFASGRRGQGGSTITMQVARNFFLSSERSYLRKMYEIALAYKIEAELIRRPHPRGLRQPDLPRPARLRVRCCGADLLRQEAARLTVGEAALAGWTAGSAQRLQPVGQPAPGQDAPAVRAVADAAAGVHLESSV